MGGEPGIFPSPRAYTGGGVGTSTTIGLQEEGSLAQSAATSLHGELEAYMEEKVRRPRTSLRSALSQQAVFEGRESSISKSQDLYWESDRNFSQSQSLG